MACCSLAITALLDSTVSLDFSTDSVTTTILDLLMHLCVQNKSGKEPGTRAGPVMVAVEAGLLMFGGVAGGDVPFAPECWLLQLGPSPLLGLKENEVTSSLIHI